MAEPFQVPQVTSPLIECGERGEHAPSVVFRARVAMGLRTTDQRRACATLKPRKRRIEDERTLSLRLRAEPASSRRAVAVRQARFSPLAKD